jgi:ribonuclease D
MFLNQSQRLYSLGYNQGMSDLEIAAPVWIDTPEALVGMCNDLLKENKVAVDTESNSLHAYQERVCLIQFSNLHTDYLVDPLAISDLSPLAPIFSSPEIVKVFHAAEYDLICLKRDYHFQFQNIFDTMLAARILSYPAFGLGAILENKFGIILDKRYQKADWAKRPMSAAMLSYARMDTHFLVNLMDIMVNELAAKHLDGLAAEDFNRISRVNGVPQDTELESLWKISGAHYLNPRQAAVLRELVNFRNKEAKRRDQPSFKVIHNDLLLQIADVCPETREALQNCGVNTNSLSRYGNELLTAVKTGLQKEPLYPPKVRKCDQELKARIENLKSWRKQTASQYKVESDVILPRDLLVDIAEKQPATLSELSELMHYFPWRFQQFGSMILSVFN